jgi:hypothetical protein
MCFLPPSVSMGPLLTRGTEEPRVHQRWQIPGVSPVVLMGIVFLLYCAFEALPLFSHARLTRRAECGRFHLTCRHAWTHLPPAPSSCTVLHSPSYPVSLRLAAALRLMHGMLRCVFAALAPPLTDARAPRLHVRQTPHERASARHHGAFGA